MNEFTANEVETLQNLCQIIGKRSNNSDWVKEPTSIFCNPQHPGGLWSMAGKGDTPYVDCPASRLRGKMTRLWSGENSKGKIIWHLEVQGREETYLIHAPHDRGFSRTMLTCIGLLTTEQAAGEIIIECRAWKASEGMMQFCSLQTADGTKIDAPKVASHQLDAIAAVAQDIIGGR